MAKHYLIFLTICFTTSVLNVTGDASGTANPHVEESHNFAAAIKEERARRDVAAQVAQRTTAMAANDLQEEDNSQKGNNQMNLGSLKELNIIKRTPSGFMGMRGKKEYDPTDVQSDSNAFDWDWDSNEADDTENDFNGNRFKKAPAAFYGVRGKKYTKGGATLAAGVGTELTHLNDFLDKLEEERMREQLVQELLNRVAASTLYQNDINKRAPIGFTGVRGKRPLNLYYDDLEQDGELPEFEKRGPANAFVGLRGKKDVAHLNYKRSSMEPYNTRGRNQRFVDFSNKFVAVRGKKNSVDDLSSFFGNGADTQLFSYPTANERYLVGMFTSPLYGANGKRTPSGFMGMRGKRAATDAATDEAAASSQESSATDIDAQ